MKKGTKVSRGPSDVDRLIGQKVRDRRMAILMRDAAESSSAPHAAPTM